MPGAIAEAFVEIRPDVGRFPTDLRRDVDRAFEGVRRSADDLGGEIEDSFREAATQSGRSMSSLGGDVQAVANEITNAFTRASRKSDAELRDIGGGAFTPVTEGAATTAAAVASTFSKAASRSDAELRDIGGGAFVPVAESATAAAAGVTSAFSTAANRSDAELRDIGGAAFIPAVESATVAAGEVAGAFTTASIVADTQLRDIGGADAFAPLVASAGVAGAASEKAAGRSSSAFKGMVGAAVLATTAAVAAIGGGLAGLGVVGAAKLEQTRIGFTALLGSAEEADAFIRNMQDFAAKTPFEFPGLADMARRWLAIGPAIGMTKDEVIPTISTIGDLVAVLGAPPESLDRITVAFGQMASRGKVQLEELLQIGEALPGFNPLKALADGMGVTTAQAQDMISKGMIPADKGIRLLIDGMGQFPGAAGAMVAQSQTLLGLFSTMKDTVGLALTQAFTPLTENLKTILPAATEQIGVALGALAPPISNLVTALLPVFLDLLTQFAPFLGTLFGLFADMAKQLSGPLSEALKQILPAISQILTALAPVLPIILQDLLALAPAAATLATAFASIVSAIPPQVLAKLVEAFIAMKAVNGVLGPVGKLGTALKDVGKEGGVFMGVAQKLMPNLKDGVPALKLLAGGFVSVAKAVKSAVLAAGPYVLIAAAIAAVAYVIYQNWDKIAAFFSDLWGSVQEAASSAFNWIKENWTLFPRILIGVLTGGMSEVVGFLFRNGGDMMRSLLSGITGAVTAIWNYLMGDFAAQFGNALGFVLFLPLRIGRMIIEGLLTGLVTFVPMIWDWLKDLPGAILGFLVDATVWLVDTGINLLTGLLNGIVSGAEAVWSWLLDLPNKVLWFLVGAVGWLTDVGKDVLTGLWNGLVSMKDWLGSMIGQLPGWITGWLSGALDWLHDVAVSIVVGLWRGLESMKDWLWDKVTGFFGGIWDAAKSAVGMGSPSKLFFIVGEAIGEGLGLGITSTQPIVTRAVNGLLSNMAQGFDLDVALNNNAAMAAIQKMSQSAVALNAGSTSGVPSANITRLFMGASRGPGDGTEIVFESGSITAQFTGRPSELEATRIGTALGDGIAEALNRRRVLVTARTQ